MPSHFERNLLSRGLIARFSEAQAARPTPTRRDAAGWSLEWNGSKWILVRQACRWRKTDRMPTRSKQRGETVHVHGKINIVALFQKYCENNYETLL